MQLLVYVLVYPIIWVISILPFRVLYFFSDFLYFTFYYVVGYRKKVVIENLNLAFPEKSKEEKDKITKQFYQYFCDTIVESLKSLTISDEQIKKRMSFTNLEVVKEIEKNKPIAYICAHYGNWEWIFVLQHYFENRGYAVYKPLRNKYFDRLVKKIRAKHKSYLISTREAYITLLRAKKQDNLASCGFVSDQSPKISNAQYWREFMGVKVPVIVGTEVLAKKLDMAVVFFVVKRVKRGYYETTFQPIAVNPQEFENYKITDRFIELVENEIKKAPQYYLWTHKRWKHRDKVPQEFK
ncbi:KDO2-lipid IV(A) lauroyltransferase [Flavobacteriaceae bacterium MAR_2010_188]|nr:KDO2-lipid IV(A) lauroyltransferase [Flavobacteriaceae bacterium MAR_2010_188]